MRSTICAMNSRGGGPICVGLALIAAVGCARIPNMFVDDSPTRGEELESPSSADIRQQYAAGPERARPWPLNETRSDDTVVRHGPLYYEDPFEDKGSGHPDSRWGWEDYVAAPYNLARYVLNTVAVPVSLVVTPPWQAHESDGELSRQLLGEDHDAVPVGGLWFAPRPDSPPPTAASQPDRPEVRPPPSNGPERDVIQMEPL